MAFSIFWLSNFVHFASFQIDDRHDANNYRSPSSHKKGRITTFQPRYGLCGSVLSTVASLRLEMALVKKAGHLIRLDDCFDRSVDRANYEKVKKYMRTYHVFCEESRVQFQNGCCRMREVAGSIPKRLDERSWEYLYMPRIRPVWALTLCIFNQLFMRPS